MPFDINIKIYSAESVDRRQANNAVAACIPEILKVVNDERYGDDYIKDVKEGGKWFQLEVKITKS